MPIPALDRRGLLPPGIHICTFGEFESRFLFNVYRTHLYGRVKNFVDHELNPRFSGLRLYIGGSFLSDKDTPGDIECCIPIPKTELVTYAAALQWGIINQQKNKALHQADFYPFIEGSPDTNFLGFFQYVGVKSAQDKGLAPKDKRGMLEVSPW
jgi:uncharacterized protein DUF6932